MTTKQTWSRVPGLDYMDWIMDLILNWAAESNEFKIKSIIKSTIKLVQSPGFDSSLIPRFDHFQVLITYSKKLDSGNNLGMRLKPSSSGLIPRPEMWYGDNTGNETQTTQVTCGLGVRL